MTIAEVIRGAIVLFAIPPAPERRITVEQSPPAVPEGVSARFGAEDDLPAGRAENFGVTAVASIDENTGGLELLTRRGRLWPPRPNAARAGLGAAVAWRGGSELFGRWRCTPSSNTSGCRASRRIPCSAPSRRLRSSCPPVLRVAARARRPRGKHPRCTGGFCFCREPAWKNCFKQLLKKSGKAAGHLLPGDGIQVSGKKPRKNIQNWTTGRWKKTDHRP